MKYLLSSSYSGYLARERVSKALKARKGRLARFLREDIIYIAQIAFYAFWLVVACYGWMLLIAFIIEGLKY